jgi:2-polyprenyl-3-methyl-5-hydroxy-6-metoxy-1,4-benzoquinol methylase
MIQGLEMKSGVGGMCVLCGSPGLKKSGYGGYEYAGQGFTIVKCTKCSFMFLQPIPSKEVRDSIYLDDRYFDTYSLTEKGLASYLDVIHEDHGYSEEVLRLLKNYISGGKLLDVGCAGGRFLLRAQSAGFDAWGIEPNQKMVTFARQELHLNAVCGHLDSHPFPVGTFDVVHLGDVLEHLPDLKGSMITVRNLLKEGGLLVLGQPVTYNRSFFNLFLRINMALMKNEYSTYPPAHIWEFTPRVLRRFIQQSGFKILFDRVYETRPINLGAYQRVTLKNRIGFFIRILSSWVSNARLFSSLELGNRMLVICQKAPF